MALVVGTDSYLSLVDANTYWSNRNSTTWADASDEVKEKALREATQYIDGAYEFVGTQILTNVLAFPRDDVEIYEGNFAGITYDNTTIPPQVQDACAELAFNALDQLLVPAAERGGEVKREKVDVIEVEYFEFAPSGRTYDFASMLLKPLLSGGGSRNNLNLKRV